MKITADDIDLATDPRPHAATTAPAAAAQEVRRRLVHDVISLVLDIGPDEVVRAGSLAELGYTSMQLTEMAARIEEVFGIPFTPTKLFKYNGFTELTDHITNAVGGGTATAAVEVPAAPAPVPVRGEPRDDATGGAIAIIGIGCQFPGGAADPERFFRNLELGEDCVTPIRDSRPELIEDYLRDRSDLTDFPEFAAFADGVDEFDAAFFGIAPLEAQSMDPQQRKLMELTWRLLEDSGYRPSQLRGRQVGVYVGTHGYDYAALVLNRPELMDTYGAYLDSGTHPALLANRVSRWYDFRGPSRVYNTACSSSLVALNAAVTDLRVGVCTEAVVGGVNALLSARSFSYKVKAGMQAADGRCKTFDRRADGYVRGEGFGAVLLKPLAAAERDGDRIHGVIRGTSVNHDGQTDSLRAPSGSAQTALVTAAFADARVEPRTVGYVETHGTGTALGDPIEVQALIDAYHELDPELPPGSCGLGSVKTNIGHLEAAAGIAGLIKVLLCMRHEWLPGLLHFGELNPFIDMKGSPFRIVTEPERWRRVHDDAGEELPLRAGLSSFGFGGANAHLIVEEYRRPAERHASAVAKEQGPALVLLSARDARRLRVMADRLADFLREHPAAPEEVARTLRLGREALPERLAFTAESLDEMLDKLRRYVAGEAPGTGLFTGNVKRFSQSADDDEQRHRVRKWLAEGEHDRVLDLWVRGGTVDWGEADRASLFPLPTYPFASDRHWFTDTFGESTVETPDTRTRLHPLVHENVSDFREQRFRSAFTGKEFFLRDHLAHGGPELPAAAWLEAARAAFALSHGEDVSHTGVRLTDLVWDEAYASGTGAAEISLMVDADGLVDFDCFRSTDDAVFCQGRASLVVGEQPAADRGVPVRGAETSGADVTAMLLAAGVRLGPTFQAVTSLRRDTDRWVVELSLPEVLRPTVGEFVAHPVLVTAALAVAALWPDPARPAAALASVDEALLLGRCDGDATAVITERADLLDLDLSAPDGRLLLRLSGVRFLRGTR
jgi:acyl transferase domain-containing protein/acyl carrier protein